MAGGSRGDGAPLRGRAVTREDPDAAITECDIERLNNLTPAAGERN